MCLRAIKTKHYSQCVPIVGTVGHMTVGLTDTYVLNSSPVSNT